MEGKSGIGFVGAGKMGGALLSGVIEAGLYPAGSIYVAESDSTRLEDLKSHFGIRAATSVTLAEECEAVLLCVKPLLVSVALKELRPSLGPDSLLISIAAGVSTARIESELAPGVPVVRAMPNIAATLGKSATAYAGGTAAGAKELALAGKILSAAGVAVELPEALLDAVTGLSGSGPAWVFVFAEALIAGGVKAGIPHREARLLAVQTLVGAAAMLARDADVHPAVLRDAVTTPGGTTVAGLHVLEQKRFRDAVISAVQAAAERSRELGGGGK